MRACSPFVPIKIQLESEFNADMTTKLVRDENGGEKRVDGSCRDGVSAGKEGGRTIDGRFLAIFVSYREYFLNCCFVLVAAELDAEV